MTDTHTPKGFIRLPLGFMASPLFSLEAKVVLGYIHTRASIPTDDWTISVGEVSKNTCISNDYIGRLVNKLVQSGILTFVQTLQPPLGRPYKIYGIDKIKLEIYMGTYTPPAVKSAPTKPPPAVKYQPTYPPPAVVQEEAVLQEEKEVQEEGKSNIRPPKSKYTAEYWDAVKLDQRGKKWTAHS